ncbi:MAG: tetratricopeptide repeat protein [Armatimonadota bacterium]|nr:tetratricopeptide repeat protein [Armatimonadota bacterium]
MAPAFWRITLFGGLRVTLAGKEVARFETRKAGAILAALAIDLGRPKSRDELAERFWSGEEPELARNSLRQALASLRRALGDRGKDDAAFVQADRLQVRLNPKLGSSDADDFARLFRLAEANPKHFAEAIALYTGPLLPELSDDASFANRLRFAGQNIEARHRLARATTDDPDAAAQYAASAIDFDPLNEESTRLAMELAAKAGKPSEALRYFQNLTQRLRVDLAVAPSESLQKFARELSARARPRLAVRADSGSATQIAFESNVSQALTPFFGREDDLRDLLEFCQPVASDARAPRLATLTGPGGIGKTRLAHELSLRLVDSYSRAVWFVNLADSSSAAVIPARLLEAMGMHSTPEDEFTQIARRLAGCPAFVVFDNFEQLLDGGTEILQRLLERVPLLKSLVTTRESMNVGFDREFPVGALPEPALDDPVEKLRYSPSVQLFLDRASQARADIVLNAETAPTVSEICRRLEGIPLALVLAGSRAQTFPPDEMLAALDDRFALLSSERRDLPARHRTLHESIRWSYQLLPDFKSFFASLSVFRGGFAADAAAVVCDEPEASKLLEHLRARSLVISTDVRRYRMLETIREFAHGEVAAGEVDLLRRKHAEFFAALAEESHRGALGGEQSEWLATLSSEMENMRAALAWSCEHDTNIAIELAAWLWFYWNVRGSQREAYYWLKLATDGAGKGANQVALGRALHGLGASQRFLGKGDAARATLLKSIEVYESCDEARRAANPMNSLGVLEYKQGNFAGARDYLERSLKIFEGQQDLRMIAMVRANLGDLDKNIGDLETAAANLEAALKINRDIGNRVWEAQNIEVLGSIRLSAGDRDSAKSLFAESLSICDQIGYKAGAAAGREQLAEMAIDEGHYPEALTLLQDAVQIHLDSGKISLVAQSLHRAGILAALLDNGRIAAQLLGASDALRAGSGESVEQQIEERDASALRKAEDAIGPAEFEANVDIGRRLPPENACLLVRQLEVDFQES